MTLIDLFPEGWTNPPPSLSTMQKNGKQRKYSITAYKTTGTNSWFTGKAMKELTIPGNLSRTSTTLSSLSKNTGKPTTRQNKPPRLPPTMLKHPGNPWRYLPSVALPLLPQTTFGNPMTMRNTTLAVQNSSTFPSIKTAFYGIERQTKKTKRRTKLIQKNFRLG